MFIKQSHVINLKKKDGTFKDKIVQNIEPIDPTGLFPVDDEHCPDVGGKCNGKDGKVCNDKGNGNSVHDAGLLRHQAEGHVPYHQLDFFSKLHTQMVKVMGILMVVHSLAWYFPLDFLEVLLFNLFA